MGGTDEKQNEYKSLRTRREPATAPAWALSWGIEMAKTENRKPNDDDELFLLFRSIRAMIRPVNPSSTRT